MSFEDVHNYYERLVQDHLNTLIEDTDVRINNNEFEDIACIALNMLPPRYIKHDVDILFYVSEQELSQMTELTISAIKKAMTHVKNHPRQEESN